MAKIDKQARCPSQREEKCIRTSAFKIKQILKTQCREILNFTLSKEYCKTQDISKIVKNILQDMLHQLDRNSIYS